MGYSTRVTGEFTLTPPLTWPEIKGTPYLSKDRRDSDLVLRVSEEPIDTPDGELVKRTASVLAMREIDEYRADGLVETVQAAIDAFPDHTFTGRLACEGEEAGDLWRVEVHDGRAVRIEPRIVWPGDVDPEIERLRAMLTDREAGIRKLIALENAGVDNWQGYSDALAMLED